LPFDPKVIYEYCNILSGLAFIAISLKFNFNRKANILLSVDKQRYKIGILFITCGLFFIALSLIDFNKNNNAIIGLAILMACISWLAFFIIFFSGKKIFDVKVPNDIEEEINARYQIEDKLIIKNKQLEWAEKTAKICYGNWDVNKNEILFSDGVENVIGIQSQQALSFDELKNIIIPEDRIKVQRFIESATEIKGITTLLFRIIVDSKLKYIQMNAEIHGDQKTISFILGTFQDVTEQQMFIKRIEDKNETLKQIAWSQSHEVRGPLASILGLISLIDEEAMKSEHNKFILSGIKQSAEELDEMIKKIVKKTESAEVDLS